MAHKAPANYTPDNITGKAAVVTGGTSGIGRAVAQLLAERGARVLIFGRHEEELQAALTEIQTTGGEVHGITADTSRQEDVQRVFQEADQRLGGVDILVNNAALAGGSITQVGYQEIQQTVTVNVIGYLSCAYEALQRMQKQGSGHIVNIGSMSADLREEDSDIYVATKAAIQGFSESFRKSANKGGIKVSLVELGLVATPMAADSEEEAQEKLEKQEMLLPEDIAECVHYCLTQPARCDVVAVQIRPLYQTI
ncbi:MAG: SDR family oxidoreductase [Abitibacteriaceae bacterium]|nr:SDR family oxidoreductase [Abditibacteriaceae bacterium]